MLKKFAILLTIIFGLSIIRTASAQSPANPYYILVSSAPSGSCTGANPAEQTIVLGVIYTCQSGTWAVAGGGGGGGPYLPLAGGTMTGALSLYTGSTAVTQSSGDASTDIATDQFVSNAIAGVNPAVAVLAASTTTLTGTYVQVGGGTGDTFTVTATGAFSLDGIAINTIGQRVLFKNQSSANQNGVYTATVVGTTGVSPVFTRATDYDTPADVNNTGAIPVQSGTANGTTSWLLTSQVTSIGSSGSSLTYAQFSYAPSTICTSASCPAINPTSTGATTPEPGYFTTLSATGGITSTSDGVHAGIVSLPGNTTAPALPSNSVSDIGPASASFTAYGKQWPTAGPSSASLICAGALSSSVSALSFCTTVPAANLPGGVADYWSNGYNGAAQTFFNPANYVSFALMQVIQTTNITGITYYIQTTDSNTSDHYDIGISSCPSNDCTVGGATTTLVCDIGPTLFNVSAAPYHHACAQGGTITLAPGTYVLQATGSATTGAFGAASISNVLPIFAGDSLTTNSTAGQLPSSNTLPANGTWGFSMPGYAVTLH